MMVDDVVVDDAGEAVVADDAHWNAQVPTYDQVTTSIHQSVLQLRGGGSGDDDGTCRTNRVKCIVKKCNIIADAGSGR